MTATTPRVVVVTRKSDYQALLARHATRGQAEFFLGSRGQSIEGVEKDHHDVMHALDAVRQSIPESWRRQQIDRDDLDRFLFEPDDVVVAVGQDGLVANLAKYLEGQCVIGVNPLPDRYDGILVTHPPGQAGALIRAAASKRVQLEQRTMVAAGLDDGQRLLAVNEIFIGHQSHQSARYRLRYKRDEERQSSSGLIVTTGTGATGWGRSIHQACKSGMDLPAPTEPTLAFFVREAFPSVSTGTDLIEGLIDTGEDLEIVSEMNSGGVVFGDGIEADRVEFLWGQRLVVNLADVRLNLVKA